MNLPCLILGIWCTSGTVTGPAHVWDGDTLYINRQSYRLAGVDAEEPAKTLLLKFAILFRRKFLPTV